jgi:hypothetical protein
MKKSMKGTRNWVWWVALEYDAASAGPAFCYAYRVKQSTMFALGTSEPFGATMFQLD